MLVYIRTLLLPAANVVPDSFSCSGLLTVGRGGGIHLDIHMEERNASYQEFTRPTYQGQYGSYEIIRVVQALK